MSTAGDNKERNREIAANEEERQVTGAVRVSAWTIFFAVVVCAVLVYIGWAALHR